MARRQRQVAGGDPSASTILLAPLARQRCGYWPDLRVVGAERIPRPTAGSCWPVNHVSFLDPLVLAVALYDCGRRRVRFVADLFEHPLVG
jgi:hypothetical protein